MFKSTPYAEVCGTSFHDVTIKCSLKKLVKLFGKSVGASDKVTHEWVLTGPDGRVVTVYDYKYNGAIDGYWHVGAYTKETCLLFRDWFIQNA